MAENGISDAPNNKNRQSTANIKLRKGQLSNFFFFLKENNMKR